MTALQRSWGLGGGKRNQFESTDGNKDDICHFQPLRIKGTWEKTQLLVKTASRGEMSSRNYFKSFILEMLRTGHCRISLSESTFG